jgi:hypothetical protein
LPKRYFHANLGLFRGTRQFLGLTRVSAEPRLFLKIQIWRYIVDKGKPKSILFSFFQRFRKMTKNFRKIRPFDWSKKTSHKSENESWGVFAIHF